MDPDILRWCTEFIARQETVSDNLLIKILSVIPAATERPSLQKELVIRACAGDISEGLITESILNSLEKMEELDRSDGIKVADSLKRAYCAAAVYCTTVYLEGSLFKNGKYLEAVDRIWRGRIRGLESIHSELITDELKEFGDEIEAALWDARARKRLVARPINAMHLVDAWLNEVSTIMGTPFLEVVALSQSKQQNLASTSEVRARNPGNVDSCGVDAVGVEEPSSHANEGIEASGTGSGEVVALRLSNPQNLVSSAEVRSHNLRNVESGGVDVVGVEGPSYHANEEIEASGTDSGEILKEFEDKYGQSVELRTLKRKEFHGEIERPNCKHPTSRRQARRPVIINDMDDEDMHIELPPQSKYDILPSPVVDKVTESLRARSLELHRAVRDPLPDALKMAEAVQSKIARNQRSSLNTANTPKSGEIIQNVGSHSLKSSVHTQTGGQAVQDNVPRPSLMERNVTAHTYEWDDDSVDRSPQRILLDDPKRTATSPLNKQSRRHRGNWTSAEEEALLQGVKEYGVGNWKVIWDANHDVLALRSTVDLKDKWRNMQKYHRGRV